MGSPAGQRRNHMGQVNNEMNHYLSDEKRFADLFNGVHFQGRPVIQASELQEGSEKYDGTEAENPDTGERSDRRERIRDIKKKLQSGETLRILAVENQNLVDYTMPFRCMQMDTMEYQMQLEKLRRANEESDAYDTPAERFCRMRKTDRLAPVHTLCLYHGEEPWDGPRTLKDMMAFHGDEAELDTLFSDYPMHLFCINEESDFSMFHTELRELFTALRYRKDKKGLRKLLQEDEAYRHLEADTVKVMSVMLNAPKIWEDRENYMNRNEEEREEYDMCQALREWIEEEREDAIAEFAAKAAVEKEELREEVREEGIMALVNVCQELGASRRLTVSKVAEKYFLSKQKAEECVEQYWK